MLYVDGWSDGMELGRMGWDGYHRSIGHRHSKSTFGVNKA